MATLSVPEPWQRAAAGYERYGRHLPAIAAAVFALLLGRALADLVWAFVPLPAAAQWQPPPVAAPARKASEVDIAAIVNAGLFGRYQAPSVEATVDAPETSLNLVLLGLLADDDERDSRALIAQQGGAEAAYAIGDDVAPGVQLQAIFPDRVILQRNGRLETLRLDRESGGAPGAPSVASAAPAAEEASPASAMTQQLAQIRDEVLKDPARASEYIRVQPSNAGGQLKGYRVYPGRDRSIFNSAGLRPGDLVTSVNGVQLDDPAKALQMLGDLTQSSQVTLTIERGGQPQTISVNLN